jgi:exosome complex component CSL4
MPKNSFVIPGDLVEEASLHKCDFGTFQENNSVYSSVVGFLQLENSLANEKAIVRVVDSSRTDTATQIPKVGSVVIGRVTRISYNVVSVSILMFDGGLPLASKGYSGQLRRENIAQSEVDALKIEDCFKPGDIIKAEIVSLGDARNYVLSVLQPIYGVIQAKSPSSNTLLEPVSLSTMKDPSTGEVFKRKVALEE